MVIVYARPRRVHARGEPFARPRDQTLENRESDLTNIQLPALLTQQWHLCVAGLAFDERACRIGVRFTLSGIRVIEGPARVGYLLLSIAAVRTVQPALPSRAK